MSDRGAGAYARSVERVWAALVERPVIFSPQDWNRVADWHARGIPLVVIREALDEASARARKRGKTGPTRLAAIAPAVDESWAAVMDGRSTVAEPAEQGLRLGRAAGRWETLIGRGGPLADYLRAVNAALEQGTLSPESAAGEIDERLAGLVPDELLRQVEQEVDARLQGFGDRLGPAALARTRRRAVLEGLRRATGVGRAEWES